MKKNSLIPPGPRMAMLEIYRKCNLRCPSCPLGNGSLNSSDPLPLNKVKEIIDKISSTVEDLSLFNYGEPLLHPEVVKIVSYCKLKGINRVNIHTNGLVLNKELSKGLILSGLDRIRFSVDAATEKSYKKYRVGGNFKLLLKKIDEFLSLKKELSSNSPSVEVQMIVMKHNESEIEKFYNLFKGKDVKIRYKTFNAHMSGFVNKNKSLKFLPSNKRFSRYKDSSADLNKEKYEKLDCNWPVERIIINSDGSLSPCCYGFEEKYSLGNVFNKNWWNTVKRINFIKDMGKGKISICEHCPKGIPSLKIDGILNEK